MQRVLALGGARQAARAAGGGKTRRLCGAVVSARIALREDERLARRVAGGSRRAVAALTARYSEQLYAYCYLLLHDTDLAYDALQATLARAVKALRLGEGEGFLRPWLFRIARDEATGLARTGAAPRTAARDLPTWVGRSQSGADERARLALLAGDLHALPELQRSALLMRELSGLTHREIGAALEIAPPRVKQAIFHARRALAELEQGRSLACEEVRRTISHGDRRKLRSRMVSAHLRACGACAAFAAAIPSRSGDLQALVPPLAPALATGLLTHLLAGSTARPAGGLLSGLAGKSAGAGLAGKTALAAAIAATAGGGLAVGALAQAHRRALGADGGAPFGLARQTQTPIGAAHRHTTDRSSPKRPRAWPVASDRIAAGVPQAAGPTPDSVAPDARSAPRPRAVPTPAIGGSQGFAFKHPSHAPAPVSTPIRRAGMPTRRGAAPGARRHSGMQSSHPGGARARGHERGRGGLAGDRPQAARHGERRDSSHGGQADERHPGAGRRTGEPAATGHRAAPRSDAPMPSNAPTGDSAAPGATPKGRVTKPAAPGPLASSDAAQAATLAVSDVPAGGQSGPMAPTAHGPGQAAAPPQASSPSA